MAKHRVSLFTLIVVPFILGLTDAAPARPHVLTYYKSDPHNAATAEIRAAVRSGLTCDACKDVFSVVRRLFDKGVGWDDLAKISVDICDLAKIENPTVCHGIIWLFKDEIFTVFDKVALSSDVACYIVIGESCSKGYDPWNQNWTIKIPGNKPPVKPIVPKPGAPTSRILHLTDIHYDPLYTPGLSNDCGEPLCCRVPNKKGSGSTAAGYWGDYSCDVPYHLVLNLMQTLRHRSDEYDWVYWTGDLPAHNVWNSSRESVLAIISNLTDLMATHLAGKNVFPCYGNHESAPVNSFPPPFVTGDLSLSWLYAPTAEKWAVWLSRFPEWPTINATIRRGGYYVVKPRAGLRIISLQTNYCNRGSYWLLINSTDPAGQLQWLIKQLLDAERNGDKVHIIGHIAPAQYSCLPVWALNYNNIVNRFESTIVGQFFGHSHQDSFYLHFDPKNTSRATNVAYVSPSVTTYQNVNPGYRYYIVDGNHNESTSCLIDHVNFFMDLTKSNEQIPPNWQFEYSAKNDYRMSDFQPASWYDVVKRFQTNQTLFTQYFYHHTKMFPLSRNPPQVCDSSCECILLCETLRATYRNYGLYNSCRDIKAHVGNKTVSCYDFEFSDYEQKRIQSC